MMNNRLFATALFALAAFVSASLPAAPSADVRETEIELNTYPFSDPDPVPCTAAKRYPYFRFDGQAADGVMRKWKAVELENAKIKVTAIPEVGGKVWGALDKRTGKEFIYFNHSVKFRNIAMRGPWTSGGIELNFGILGHSPLTANPVDWTTRKNDDGSVSYIASATEFINRTAWQVKVRLGADDDFFTTHVTWFNASNVNCPYYTWMTGAYKASGDPRFYFPGTEWIGHDGVHHPWPVDETGRDRSRYLTHADFGDSQSYHVINGDSRFFGIWWPEDGYGSYHENVRGDKFGRKIFFWAHSRAGGIWEDLLTDTDGQYIELQSGRAFQQPTDTTWQTPFKHPTFAPGATDRYVETWGVVHDRAAFDKRMDAKDQVTRPVDFPSAFDWKSAYGLYMTGEQALRDRDRPAGRRALKAALEKDAYLVPAMTCLASSEYEDGRYAEARALCARALAINAYDPEANYVDGLAAAAQGDFPTAVDRLDLAAFSPNYRAAAFAACAKVALRQGDAAFAAERARKTLSANADSVDGAMLLAAAARHGAAATDADGILKRFFAALPLNHGLRYEAYRRGWLKKAELTAAMRCELPAWNWVELGGWYESAGLLDEALEIFGLAGDDTLALIRSADVLARLGRTGDAKSALTRAAARPAAFVLPFRHEDRAALERAVRANGSWKFRYYLALLHAAKGEDAEADRLLAACDKADEPSFFLYRARRRSGAAKLADLEKARSLDAGWRPVKALADHYEDAKDPAKMLEVTSAAVGRFKGVNPIEIAHARALLLSKKHRDCIDYLKTVKLLPSEMDKRDNASGIWKEACKALGETALAESYPENIGVGKPFPKEKGRWSVKLADPLEWLYPDSKVADVRAFGEIDVASNGVADVNILFNGLDPEKPLTFSSDRTDGEWFVFRDVPVERNTAVRCFTEPPEGPKNPYVTRRAPFRVYDVLEPVAKGEVKPGASTAALRWRLARMPVGKGGFDVRLTVAQGGDSRTLTFKVNVHPVTLPGVGAASFKYTNWCDYNAMATRHGVEPWSDAHFAMIERYMALAAKGRQNAAWLPCSYFFSVKDGKIAFDEARFGRLVGALKRAGIAWFEGGHLAARLKDGGSPQFKVNVTGRMTDTPEGERDLTEICGHFARAVEKFGLKDRWFQHVADEPGPMNIANYVRMCKHVRQAMPWAKLSDAIEHTDALAVVDVPVPKTNGWAAHRPAYDAFEAAHPHSTWCYVCCEPGGKWLNRLYDGELLRPTYLSWACALFGFDGFLHWGYNHYGQMDPFTTGCRGNFGCDGKVTLPAGDTHIVYPGKDGPWPSVRLEAHRAGMEDLEVLRILRASDAALADRLIRCVVRGFDEYTADARLYRRVRREALESAAAIRKAIECPAEVYPRVNGDYKVKYSGHLADGKIRRGVMLGLNLKEEDYRQLGEWGVTLARFQMSLGFHRIDYWKDIAAYGRYIDGELDRLERELVWAAKYGVMLVVDLHVPPGSIMANWDMRMSVDERYFDAYVKTWEKIARRFKGDKRIYGYDLINEPTQGRHPVAHSYWDCQNEAAKAIRKIDPDAAIIVESNETDTAPAFAYLSPLAMDNVVYEAHMYLPMEFTHQGVSAGFPKGTVWPDESKGWNKEFIRRKLQPVIEFQKRHNAKIYIGEFSAIAWSKGAENYIRDCVELFEEYGWDWTFHAYREWNGWSIEHEGADRDSLRPSADNPRKRVMLEAFRKGNAARVAEWEGGERRRTLDWFSENQFGVTPIGRPADEKIGERSVTFADGKITINIHLSLPEGASAQHPVPVFLFGDHVLKTHEPPYTQGDYDGIPTNAITGRGYAYVRWNFNDVCPNAALYSHDLHRWSEGVIAWQATGNPKGSVKRTPTGWGTIGAWAWGFSRVMDWIETRPELDAKRVAVLGHSRGGKTALWAGAQDTRFAMVISNGSGCGGAKLNDFDCEKSEHISQIIYNFPNWFCQRYYRWAGCDREIERDSDDLLRLVAPRICYVASGSEDAWAGPPAERAAWERARDIWQAYGCPEKMGYHCHDGPHKLNAFDWERFMDFADRHL